jgi:pyrroline-5-carboxylate reductase
MLCVKPKDLAYVLDEIREEIEGKLIISIVAATPLMLLRKKANNARFVRAMPNIAVLVQESFTAYCCDENITVNDKKVAERIFKSMGDSAEIDEKHMDAITGLSGSAPAYTAIIIESLMYAGLKTGLPRKLALDSSIKAVLGGAKLALKTDRHIAELKDMVVTPGGVTIEAIYQLEDSGIRTAIIRAVEAAAQKSKKITEELVNKSSK